MNLTEKEELKENFYQIYNEKILPALSQLEFHRKRLLKTLDNFTYTHMLKKECLPVLLDCFDFIQYGKYPHYSIYNYRMFSKSYSQGNILSSFFEAHKNKLIEKDVYCGKYKAVKFQMSELEKAIIRDKNDLYNFNWKGIVITLDFNKRIAQTINVTPISIFNDLKISLLFSSQWILFLVMGILFLQESKEAYWLIGLMSLLIVATFIFIFKWKTSKINLEDIRFNKKYYVECDDEIEARYILTTSFMDRLNNLKTVFGSKHIWVNFKNNQVTFAIKTNKDLFEIGNIYTPATDKKYIEKFFNEIIAITDIIDHFKLNEKTGL